MRVFDRTTDAQPACRRGAASALRVSTRVAIILFVSTILLLAFEKRLIYHPTAKHEVTPRDLGFPFEDLRLRTTDGVSIHGFFLPDAGSSLTILLCHGNGGNISHRLDRVILARAKMPLDFLLFDYRGYGLSEGTPDERGTYRDAHAAWDWLTLERRIAPERIVIFGESVGCAVALELAVAKPARALVLEAPFESLPAMARARLPFLPLGPFMRTRYDNTLRISHLRMPLLVLHGTKDEVIPFAQGKRLFDMAPEPRTFYAIEGAGHNDTYMVGGRPYWNAIAHFLSPLAIEAATPGSAQGSAPGPPRLDAAAPETRGISANEQGPRREPPTVTAR